MRLPRALLGFVLSILSLGAMTTLSFAATYCVRPTQQGNGDGSTWTNAKALSSVISSAASRGHTYYVSGESYGGAALSASVSGTSLITIKKATTSDHVTDTGWDASWGTTTASFSDWSITTGYWYIDGQEGGGPGNWTSGYGFTIYNEAERPGLIMLQGTVHGLTIRHTKAYSNRGEGHMHGIKGTVGSFDNIVISYSRLSEMYGVHFHMNSWTNVIVEYCYLYANKSTATMHGELTSSIGLNKNITFRYNLIDKVEGTATFAGVNKGRSDNWKIYGNIVSRSQAFINYSWYGNDFNDMINSKIFNNTIVSVPGGIVGGVKIMQGNNNYIYNNLWVNNVSNTFGLSPTADYNYAYNNKRISETCNPYCDKNSDIAGTPNGQIGTNSPFVSYDIDPLLANLAAVTNPGLDTSSLLPENSVDMYGNVRGADGNWDRGAIEFINKKPLFPNKVQIKD